MRGRQYLSRPGLRRHGAVLAGALLTLLSTHRRHHSRHRPPLGRHPLAGSWFGPSHHHTRRGRRRGWWSQ
jgi:hypothetical protein